MFELRDNLERRLEIDGLIDAKLNLKDLRTKSAELGVFLQATSNGDPTYTCDAFVFGMAGLKAPWFNPGTRYRVMTNAENYLVFRGYKPTNTPHPKDIVGYWRRNKLKHPTTGRLLSPQEKVMHYGLVSDNGMILSKWGDGPLFLHQVEDVPIEYGDTVSFYTKDTNPILGRLRARLAWPKVRQAAILNRGGEVCFLAEHPEEAESYFRFRARYTSEELVY